MCKCFLILSEFVKYCFILCLLAGLRNEKRGSLIKPGKRGYCNTCMTAWRYEKHQSSTALHTFYSNKTWNACFPNHSDHSLVLWQKCLCISLSQVSDDNFEMLLSYIDGLQGLARSSTLQKAEAIVRWEGEGEEADTADAEKRQQRAKQVVQMLWWTRSLNKTSKWNVFCLCINYSFSPIQTSSHNVLVCIM